MDSEQLSNDLGQYVPPSWIGPSVPGTVKERKRPSIFGEGKRLKALFGESNVLDLSIGDPTRLEKLNGAAEAAILSAIRGDHGYCQPQGLPEAREFIAGLESRYNVAYSPEDVIITPGSNWGSCLAMGTLGEGEVIIPEPYFFDYNAHVNYFGGGRRVVPVRQTQDFDLDLAAIEAVLSTDTVALMINSPNNPTGQVYSQKTLKELAALLERKSSRIGRDIVVIFDQAYRDLLADKNGYGYMPLEYGSTISLNTFSKSLLIPGERIGYIAVHPEMKGSKGLVEQMVKRQQSGPISASVTFQRALPGLWESRPCYSKLSGAINAAQGVLESESYNFQRPCGAFYILLRSPAGSGDSFADCLKQENILAIPGSAFGRAAEGYVRLAIVEPAKKIEGFRENFRRAKAAQSSGAYLESG